MAEDDEELSNLIDGYVHYAMAFVNPKGVESVMATKRNTEAYGGFKIVNKDAEEKTKQAKAGIVIKPKHDESIAEKVRKRRGQAAKVVEKSTIEVDLG